MKYKKGSFTVIPNKEQLKGKPSQMQSIYFWICEHADTNGNCFPTRKTISQEAGVDIKTVDKYLLQLEEGGFLSKENRMKVGKKEKTSNLYQILIIEDVIPKKDVPPKTVQRTTENGATPSTENGAETIPIINSIQLTVAKQSSAEINEIIDLFKELNPEYEKWYKNTTQRKAVSELLEKYGHEKVFNMVTQLPEIVAKKYAPRITTPHELKRDLGKLLLFIKQESKKTTTLGAL